MSYRSLPERPSMLHPRAAEYGETILAWSIDALATTRHILDVPYGSDPWQSLDIYLPPEPMKAGRPVFMFLHGGGWTSGHKEWMGFLAPHFTAQGIVFISVGYRLAPEYKFPAPLLDAVDAMAWVHRHIHQYGGSGKSLFVGGHSAGGHLATLATLQPALLNERGVPESTIQACLPLSAPMDLRAPGGLRDPGQERVYRDLLAHAEDATGASPIAHVRASKASFLIGYGELDFPRIIDQSRVMAQALRQAGCQQVTLLELARSDHFDTNMNGSSIDDPWVTAATALILNCSDTIG